MTEMYQQPRSKTMDHNANVILNDVKGEEEGNKPLESQNAMNYSEPIEEPFEEIYDPAVEEQPEGDEIYLDIDKNQSTGMRITWRPKSLIEDVELFFHGRNRADQSEYTYTPEIVNWIKIEQDFVSNVADIITVSISCKPVDAINLFDNYRELKAHLYVRSMDKNEEIDRENPIIDRDYMVIMKDKELRKRMSKQALIPNKEEEATREHFDQMFTNIELQLFTEKEYELAGKRFHFILTQATVKDAIFYAVKQMGVDKISMPEPENDTIYTNLVIPPQQSFYSFLTFLQDRYGIYNAGCTYYYTEDIIFIYPPYKRVVTDCPETAHFYCTGDGSFVGHDFYHAKDQNNMYHIVVNHTPAVKEFIDAGTENYGNIIWCEHLEQLIDKMSSIGEGAGGWGAFQGLGEIDVHKENMTKFSLEGNEENDEPKDRDYGIINNPQVQTFIATANQYKYRSMLHSYRGTYCSFEWAPAEPYFVRPGYAIKWHIDGEPDSGYDPRDDIRDDMEYKTFDGIARNVAYTIKPAGTRIAHRFPFSCTAQVLLDLDYRGNIHIDEPSSDITNDDLTEVEDQTENGFIKETYGAMGESDSTESGTSSGSGGTSTSSNSGTTTSRSTSSTSRSNKSSSASSSKSSKNSKNNSSNSSSSKNKSAMGRLLDQINNNPNSCGFYDLE